MHAIVVSTQKHLFNLNNRIIMDELREIISNIANREAARLAQADELSVGLLAGDMGSVLFLYEYSQIGESYRSTAEDLLEKVLDSLRSRPHLPTYCGGVAGMGIGLGLLGKNGFIDIQSDVMRPVDMHLSVAQSAMLSRNQHDFLHGFIGLGFYWLMRHRQGDATYCVPQLNAMLDHLLSSCDNDNGVVRWPLPAGKLTRPYNISISHGCSSTIILLCEMLWQGVLPERHSEITGLIRGAVGYILKNRLDPEHFGCWFASTSLDCDTPRRSRLAWCYGDLGVAVALNRAAEVLDDATAGQLSLQVLEYSAKHRRDLIQNQVHDACVCHGAAGVGLVMREMSKRLRSTALGDAADYWRGIVTDMAVKDATGAVFPYFDVTDRRHTDRRSILEGDTGVAMYLLGETAGSSLAEIMLLT